MRKNYEKPEINLFVFKSEDVMTLSYGNIEAIKTNKQQVLYY